MCGANPTETKHGKSRSRTSQVTFGQYPLRNSTVQVVRVHKGPCIIGQHCLAMHYGLHAAVNTPVLMCLSERLFVLARRGDEPKFIAMCTHLPQLKWPWGRKAFTTPSVHGWDNVDDR